MASGGPFEGVVSKCIAAGLVAGEGFSIDASLIKADAGRKQRVPGDEPIAWPRAEEASRAVREYLAALDAADHDEEIGGDDDGSSRGGKRRKPHGWCAPVFDVRHHMKTRHS